MSSLYQPPVAQDIEIIGSRVVSDGLRGGGPVIENRKECCLKSKSKSKKESKNSRKNRGSVPCGALPPIPLWQMPLYKAYKLRPKLRCTLKVRVNLSLHGLLVWLRLRTRFSLSNKTVVILVLRRQSCMVIEIFTKRQIERCCMM